MRSYRSTLVLGACLFALAPLMIVVPRLAQAQSAADKATARGLAREGIDLFKAGKFAESLDKLQRAEELYDAPVHLIYIARCQDKLGLVVESTETYRRLVRLNLGDNEPDAFKQAVADAKKELPLVEPKLAGVKILVEPANVEGLKLEIDGTKVSAAVVGVDRPANPGTRKITASAPGYKPTEQTVELSSGQTKSVKLVLEKDPNAVVGTSEEDQKDPIVGKDKGGKDDKPPEPPAGAIGFMLGARLGGGTMFGDLRNGDPIKDYYGPFFGFELRGGVRIAGRFSGILFGGGYAYQVGSLLNQFPDNNGSTADVTTQSGQVGVGFQYAPPPQHDGIFGEIDLLLVDRFETKRDVSVRNAAGTGLQESCKQTLVASGNGLRLLGGYQFSLSRLFQLSPYLGVTFAQVRDVSVDSDCETVTAPESGLRETPWETDQGIPSGDRTFHGMLTVGIGGEFTFGADNPSK